MDFPSAVTPWTPRIDVCVAGWHCVNRVPCGSVTAGAPGCGYCALWPPLRCEVLHEVKEKDKTATHARTHAFSWQAEAHSYTHAVDKPSPGSRVGSLEAGSGWVQGCIYDRWPSSLRFSHLSLIPPFTLVLVQQHLKYVTFLILSLWAQVVGCQDILSSSMPVNTLGIVLHSIRYKNSMLQKCSFPSHWYKNYKDANTVHKTAILVKSGHILGRKSPLVFPLMSYGCSASTLWFTEVPKSKM